MVFAFARRFIFIALVSGAGGCAAKLYEGPLRPTAQVAILTPNGTSIHTVDGIDVAHLAQRWDPALALLPGAHELSFRLDDVPNLEATVCVVLWPGHRYSAEAVKVGAIWEPRIVDTVTRGALETHCQAAGDRGSQRLTRLPGTGVVAPGPETAPASPDSQTPPALPEPQTPPPPTQDAFAPQAAPASPSGGGTAALGPASVPQTPAIDQGEDQAPKHPVFVEVAPLRDVVPPRKKPGSGFSVFFGFGAGGEEFANAKASDGDRTLTTGKGGLFGLGAMVTPWWPADALGIGAGVDVAWKGEHIDAQNGDASLRRFPLAFTAHLLTNFDGRSRHFLLVRAGVSRELGIHYHLAVDGQSDIDVDADGTWGGTFRAGYYLVLTELLAADATFFVTLADHIINDVHVGANSAGLTIALHFNL